MTIVTTTFELKDGRELRCEYSCHYDPGGYWQPPEWNVSEPEYFLDDELITDFSQLPKGLDVIAKRMYECGPGEFNRSESDENEDYYDGIEPDFDC